MIMGAVRHAARILPLAWRQRIRAAGLRMAAARQPLPPGAEREAGMELILDCALCGKPSARHRVIGHVTSTQQGAFSVREHRLVLCEACEVIYLSPPPSLQDLKLMYEDSTQCTDG
jgi:hypothetical protein